MNLVGALGRCVELVGEVLNDGTVRHAIEVTHELLHLRDQHVCGPECGPQWTIRHP